MKRPPATAPAAMAALLQLSAALAEENTAVLVALHSAPAPIEFVGLPPAGTQGESLRFDLGPASGLAASAASLPSDPHNLRLGIEQMFIEFAGPDNNRLDGLRLFADRAGLRGNASSALSAVAENLIVGSREGSLVRQQTGSLPGGGALIAAERASLRLAPQRQDGLKRPFGDRADRGDAIHLRAEIWNLRFADVFFGNLFPALSAHPELREILSGDGGVTLDADGSVTRLSAAVGLNLGERPLLRFSARLVFSFAGEDTHAVEGFVTMDGAGSGDGSADTAESAWARRLADILAERMQRLNSSSSFVQAIRQAALGFSETGERSISNVAGTVPAVQPAGRIDHRFSAIYAFAASLSRSAEKSTS